MNSIFRGDDITYSYLQEHVLNCKRSNLLQILLVIYCKLIATIMHMVCCIVLQVQILDTLLNV